MDDLYLLRDITPKEESFLENILSEIGEMEVIGSGSVGKVYKITFRGKAYAIKSFYPYRKHCTPDLIQKIELDTNPRLNIFLLEVVMCLIFLK